MQIVPVFKPSEIYKYYDGKQSQVFVFDDCFGSIYVHDKQWSDYIKHIENILTNCQEKKHILLMSSRRYIYEDISLPIKEGLHPEVCDLTCETLSLNKEEKRNLIVIYLAILSHAYI